MLGVVVVTLLELSDSEERRCCIKCNQAEGEKEEVDDGVEGSEGTHVFLVDPLARLFFWLLEELSL